MGASQHTRTFVRGLVAAALLLGGSSVAWAGVLPNELPGLQAWYRVDQGVHTEYYSGDATWRVATWEDGSSGGHDMTQSNAALRPPLRQNQVNGLPGVDFDGSNDYLAAGDVEVHSNSDGLTVIAVTKPDTTSYGIIASKFNYAAAQRQWRLATTSFDVQEVATSWNADSVARGDIVPGKWYVASGTWTPGSAAQLYLDSRRISTAKVAVSDMADTAAELLLGAGNAGTYGRLNGMADEVIIYNRALSDDERLAVEHYLQSKYALQPNLKPFGADINFQLSDPGDGGLPRGYRLDLGHTFGHRGDGYLYGWSENAAGQARDRDRAASPDERFDTLVHLQNGPFGPASWELAVPQGTYWVRGVFGDPQYSTGTTNVSFEGVNFSDPDPSESPPGWDEHFSQVTVTDGRVTVAQGATGQGAKLCFFQIREAVIPDIAINFEGVGGNAHNNPLPAHYLIDDGSAFGDRGSGLRYGWIDPSTGDPLSNTHNGRNRNSGNSPEERYDTLNHLWNGGSQHYAWEIELPNCLYSVLAVFGEPVGAPNSSTNHVWFEHLRYYDVDPATGAEWDLFMGLVSVTDGRLTLRDLGLPSGAKICFLELTQIPEPTTLALLGLGLLACARRRRASHLPER